MPLAPPLIPKAGPPGPASPPTGNPGEMAQAVAQLREAVRIIEKALPRLQVGSEPHKEAVKAISGLSKAVPATEEMPGIQNSTLMGMQRSAKEGAQMQALMRMMGAQGGGGGGGAPGAGGPPGMMPPGAPPAM